MKLENRIALVTGASRGIGRSIALSFAAQGANLAVVARSHEALTEVVGGITDLGRHALSVAADLGNEADIQRIVLEVLDRFGQIDLLVNNAGIIHPPVDLAHFDPTLWRRVLDVNLTGPALLTKAVLPSMMARKSGKIINISSIGGRKGAPGRSAYRATKAALISLTESVAAEARPYGIEVTCICPGGVDTEGFREAFGSRGREEDPSLMRQRRSPRSPYFSHPTPLPRSPAPPLMPSVIQTHFLGSVRDWVGVVFAYDGTIDKYIGDAIMVHFGTPRSA